MFGVTISDVDKNGVLLTDLQQVLAALGAEASNSHWKIEGVEAVGGPAAEELEKLSDASATVSGDKLMQLASEVSQIVDGKFSGHEDNAGSPWVIISAVDSAGYDVTTDRVDVLSTIKSTLKAVEYIPGMEPR